MVKIKKTAILLRGSGCRCTIPVKLEHYPARKYVSDVITESIPALQSLSPADKLALVGELWEQLEGIGADLPVTQTQKRLLDERLTKYGNNDTPGSSWDKVKERLTQRT